MHNTSSPINVQHPGYRPDVDGLRAIAVLAVLAFHGFPGLVPGGFVGVDVFFVISGYLISGILFKTMATTGKLDIVGFYSRRIRRIFPALIVVMACVYALGYATMLADEFRSLGKHTFASAFFVSNIVSWTETGYFDASSESKPLLHLWSLGVEEQFYIAWPIMLFVLLRTARTRLAMPFLALGLASFAIGAWQGKHDFDGSYYLPFSRFWELLLGGALAWRERRRDGSALGNARLATACSLLGLLLIVVAIACLSRARAAQWGGIWPLLPTIGACLLIAAGRDGVVNRTLLSNRAMVWIGLISYPLYLWHWPALVYVDFFSGRTSTAMMRLAALLSSVVLAWLTWRFVEPRFRRPGHVRSKIALLCGMMALLGALGLATYLGNGFGWRSGAISQQVSDDVILPFASRKSDGSCGHWSGLKASGDTVCVTNAPKPDVLVLGDSHAMSLASAAIVNRFDAGLVLLAEHGCLPYSEGASASCNALMRNARALLDSAPSIRIIELSFAYSYIDAIGAEAYRKAVERMLADLRPGGRTITVVLDAPKMLTDTRNCLARSITIGAVHDQGCKVPVDAAERRQEPYRTIMREIVARQATPQVTLFDSFASLCHAGICHGIGDGTLYYFDNSHLSVSGSGKVLRDLLPAVTDSPAATE